MFHYTNLLTLLSIIFVLFKSFVGSAGVTQPLVLSQAMNLIFRMCLIMDVKSIKKIRDVPQLGPLNKKNWVPPSD